MRNSDLVSLLHSRSFTVPRACASAMFTVKNDEDRGKEVKLWVIYLQALMQECQG